MSVVTKIGVHHFGGLGNNQYASTKHLSEVEINRAHKSRWPTFSSELNGSHIGYNLIIWPNGSFGQYRYVGEETAAAVGSNFDTFHICLAGNFNRLVDRPTQEQLETLRKLLTAATRGEEALKSLGVKIHPDAFVSCSVSRIYPHRVLQPNHTECYGNSLPNDWARLLVLADGLPDSARIEDLKKKLSLYQQLLALVIRLQDEFAKQKFGNLLLGVSSGRNDEGVLTEESIKK